MDLFGGVYVQATLSLPSGVANVKGKVSVYVFMLSFINFLVYGSCFYKIPSFLHQESRNIVFAWLGEEKEREKPWCDVFIFKFSVTRSLLRSLIDLPQMLLMFKKKRKERERLKIDLCGCISLCSLLCFWLTFHPSVYLLISLNWKDTTSLYKEEKEKKKKGKYQGMFCIAFILTNSFSFTLFIGSPGKESISDGYQMNNEMREKRKRGRRRIILFRNLSYT